MLIVLAFCFCGVSFAGGPFVVDSVNKTGVAQRWQNDVLEWYVDNGPLSTNVNNSTAKQWIQEALSKWTELTIFNADNEYVPTAVVETSFKGNLSVDVDTSNYTDYYSYESGPTVVMFDADGAITAELMGEENKEVVVGLSQPLLSDSTGLRIVKGFALFNGLLLSDEILSEDPDTAEELFKVTVLHELGHLLNLDHTQVNYDIAKLCVRNGTCEDGQFIPTMYPEVLTPLQDELSRDDKIALSWIYPNSDFENDFCTITGEIFDASGNPLKGVNIYAARAGEGETMAKMDVRSYVSGVLYPDCFGNSRYYLHGIVPGRSYTVGYEPIGSEFTGVSDLEPLDNPPRGFSEGTISSTSGGTTVSCTEGGTTIDMASVTIDVRNPCTYSDGDDDDDDDDSGTSSGGCSLILKSVTGDT